MEGSQKREHAKARIINKSLEFVKSRSLEDFSVREVSKELGINIASINYYFSNEKHNHKPCGDYGLYSKGECTSSRPFKILLPSIRTNLYDKNQYYRDTAHYVESKKPILAAANVLMLPDKTDALHPPQSHCRYHDDDRIVKDTVNQFKSWRTFYRPQVEGATLFQWFKYNRIYYWGFNQCPFARYGYENVYHFERSQNENGIFPYGILELWDLTDTKHNLKYTLRLSDERYKDDENYKDSE